MCTKPYLCEIFWWYDIQRLWALFIGLFIFLMWISWYRGYSSLGTDMHTERIYSGKIARVLVGTTLMMLPSMLPLLFDILPGVVVQRIKADDLPILAISGIVIQVISALATVFSGVILWKQVIELAYVPDIESPDGLFKSPPVSDNSKRED